MQRMGAGYSTPFPIWAATDRRRDVVALHYNFGSGFMGHTRVRYSAYGVPEPVLTGDLNHDGLLNNDDRVELALIRASEPSGVVTMPGPDWTPDADLNFDGAIDGDGSAMAGGLGAWSRVRWCLRPGLPDAGSRCGPALVATVGGVEAVQWLRGGAGGPSLIGVVVPDGEWSPRRRSPLPSIRKKP
jgi:hypothetical protein